MPMAMASVVIGNLLLRLLESVSSKKKERSRVLEKELERGPKFTIDLRIYWVSFLLRFNLSSAVHYVLACGLCLVFSVLQLAAF